MPFDSIPKFNKRVPKHKQFFDGDTNSSADQAARKTILKCLKRFRHSPNSTSLLATYGDRVTTIEENLKNFCYNGINEPVQEIKELLENCYQENAHNPRMLRAARELKQLLKKGKKFSKSKLLGVKGRPRKKSLSPVR